MICALVTKINKYNNFVDIVIDLNVIDEINVIDNDVIIFFSTKHCFNVLTS